MTAINIENRKSYEKVGLIYNAMKQDYKKIFVEKLLQTEGDINYRISEGSQKVPNLLRTALVIDDGYSDLLLEHGADFTYQNEEGKTIMHLDEKSNKDLVLNAHVKFNNPSNPSDKYGMTHFHEACMKNNSSAVEFFLKNGVDVNLPINADSPRFPSYTPLHLAVKHACLDAVKTLLKYGANIHLKNGAGLSPLQMIFKKIIENPSTNVDDEQKCKTMLKTFAEFLINVDTTSTNYADELGFCKFHIACILEDHQLMMKILNRIKNINRAVNFDSPICPGYTALHFAAFSNIDMFKLLLRNGADIEVKNARGETPFDLCLQNFSWQDVHSVILTKPEWRNIVLSNNKTLLIHAISAMKSANDFTSFLNETESVMNLVVPFDSPLWPGYTMLHLAVLFTKGSINDWALTENNIASIAQCFTRGADITVKDSKGMTALHLAFYMKKQEMVKCLLDHHDKTDNPADDNNLSHLHIACALGSRKVIERLLMNGADVNSPIQPVDSTFAYQMFWGRYEKKFYICPGTTALHINSECGNEKIAEMLIKYGAHVNAQDVNGFTPIHRTLTDTYNFHCMVLLKKNLKNITTPCGLNHLHVASHNGNAKAVTKLLKLGADINAPVTYEGDVSNCKKKFSNFEPYGNPRKPFGFLAKYAGYTPLNFACNTYATTTIAILIKHGADIYAKNDKDTLPLTPCLYNFEHRKVYLEIIRRSIVLQKFLEKEYGITLLHIACHYDQLKLVKSLIKEGANVNAKVNSNSPVWQGYTPLHCVMKNACTQYSERILIETFEKMSRLLTKHGADVLSVDNNNDTPIHLIKYLNGHSYGLEYKVAAISNLLVILFENMENFNVNPVNNQGLSVFHVACLSANVAIIEKFVNNGVDVNQAIGYFSEICPGSTPLHLIIVQYCALYDHPSKRSLNEQDFFQVVNMLLDKGANVNLTNAFRNTPLHSAIELPGLSRQVMIQKFISNGANIHVENVSYNTAFENLLLIGNATWEEIGIFLNAGVNFNSYNPISQKGYMAIFLHHHQGICSLPELMENHLVLRIINNPKIFEINNSGRTVIHNLVSIKWKKHFLQTCPMLVQLIRRAADLGFGGRKNVEVNDSFYGQMIEQLLIRGCDIDYQDNDGKTALHLAAAFRNSRAIIQLLKYGADINLTDRNGKTAFAYCREINDQIEFPWYHQEIDWDSNYANKLFASLVYKLELCKQPVNEQNKNLQEKVLENLGPMEGESLDYFHNEMLKSKSIKIGNTSLNLYEFLTIKDMPVTYVNMTYEERKELDKFSENVDKQNFREIDCLVKWKYRKNIERTRLYEPAVTSLNILVNYQLPDVISRIIMKFLTNEELKRLIASVN